MGVCFFCTIYFPLRLFYIKYRSIHIYSCSTIALDLYFKIWKWIETKLHFVLQSDLGSSAKLKFRVNLPLQTRTRGATHLRRRCISNYLFPDDSRLEAPRLRTAAIGNFILPGLCSRSAPFSEPPRPSANSSPPSLAAVSPELLRFVLFRIWSGIASRDCAVLKHRAAMLLPAPSVLLGRLSRSGEWRLALRLSVCVMAARYDLNEPGYSARWKEQEVGLSECWLAALARPTQEPRLYYLVSPVFPPVSYVYDCIPLTWFFLSAPRTRSTSNGKGNRADDICGQVGCVGFHLDSCIVTCSLHTYFQPKLLLGNGGAWVFSCTLVLNWDFGLCWIQLNDLHTPTICNCAWLCTCIFLVLVLLPSSSSSP